MSQQYITYRLDLDSDMLRCYADSPRPVDFFVPWPECVTGDEEPTESDLSEAKDIITEGILKQLNARGLILVGDFPALMHLVYVAIAPGGGFVHPLTFEVQEASSFRAGQDLRIMRSDVRRKRYRDEVSRLDAIDQLADRMLLEARYADIPATEVWDIAAARIDGEDA
jgi:hypothetical protein